MPRRKANVRMELNEIPSFPGVVKVSGSGFSRLAAGFTDGGGEKEEDLEMQHDQISNQGEYALKS